MNRQALKLTVALVAALLAAALLVACGSGGDSASSSASSASPETVASQSGVEVETGPLKVVGGGSASYRIPGHYISVPAYAEEASKAELRAAATVEHGYLVAQVEKDWVKACSYISEGLRHRLRFDSKKADEDCAALLATATKPGPGGSDYESSEVEAGSLRSTGIWAYLLYRAATAPYFMPMVMENDGWKVNQVAPMPFYG